MARRPRARTLPGQPDGGAFRRAVWPGEGEPAGRNDPLGVLRPAPQRVGRAALGRADLERRQPGNRLLGDRSARRGGAEAAGGMALGELTHFIGALRQTMARLPAAGESAG